MVLNANNYNKEDSFAAAKRDGKELFVTKISMTAPNNHVLSVLIVLIWFMIIDVIVHLVSLERDAKKRLTYVWPQIV